MANYTHGLLVNIFFILVLFNTCDSARILCVYPIPFHSHQSVFRVLTEELAKRGHELVVITTMPHEKPFPNVTEIDVAKISSDIWEEVTQEKLKETALKDTYAWGITYMWTEEIYPRQERIVDAQLGTKEVRALINDKSQKFDLIFVEGCVQGSYALTARFKAPVILVSSFYGSDHDYKLMGAATHPMLFPDYTLQKTHDYSIWDKFKNIYYDLALHYHGWRMEAVWNGIIKKYIPDAPPISELKKNVHMMFLNVHHIWDNNRPVPPSILYMGALQIPKPKPLPKDLQTYMDALTNGVIFMGLGSKFRASDLPKHTVDTLFEVFASLPYNVILKWNAEKPANTPANVKLVEWIPQNDLLYHPNLKGFITHAGLASSDEAIAANVPVIGLPVCADQFYNAGKFVQFGIGYHLDIDRLDAKELRAAIMSIAEGKSYRKNMAKLAKIMEEQQAGGLEKAIYWTEYVAENGGAMHLRSPLADATLVDKFYLDVLAVALAILTLAVVSVVYIVKEVLKYTGNVQTRKKQKSN